MKKVRVGVLGAGRGMTMINQLISSSDAELVAICDSFEPLLKKARRFAQDNKVDVKMFSSFEEFLQYPMDAVVLANFANEHAPYAIRCMNAGLHVMSEVLPVQTMKEAVELIETVEKTGKIYSYAENYCYMPAPYEMRRLYREGKIGEFEYAEGEYMHNCEDGWHGWSQGNPDHWRNTMYATYYCTHSAGPLIHISGLRPVSVTAFEMPFNERMKRMGAKAGNAAVEMITLENGAVIKSLHGVGCSRNSIWYSVYGSEGRLESAREDAEVGGVGRIYTNLTKRNPNKLPHTYEPKDVNSDAAMNSGHGGSDFYTVYNFVRKIKGDETADVIDVYEAMDMFLPGIMGYQSILKGGVPVEIPNLRDPAVREQYRNNTACTDPKVAGDQLLPSYSKGNPEIPQENYDALRAKFEKELSNKKQLKLYVFPKKKLPFGLPEGYTITKYTGTEEEAWDWIQICKNGLAADNAGMEMFEGDIMNFACVVPETDLFFIVDPNGKRVATITAMDRFRDSGMGGVHMVSVDSSARGLGLGHVLCRIAEQKLYQNHVRIAQLTTDDWRKPACKAYLKAGWYPVNYDDDMVERWTNIITELGIESVQMVNDNGEPDVVIYAKK